MDRLTVLFAGLGSISGQRYVRNLKRLLGDSVDIPGLPRPRGGPVLNTDMTVRPDCDLESAYGIRSFTNLDDALAQRPDAAFVTNPNTLHLPVALAAAKAGCHRFSSRSRSRIRSRASMSWSIWLTDSG